MKSAEKTPRTDTEVGVGGEGAEKGVSLASIKDARKSIFGDHHICSDHWGHRGQIIQETISIHALCVCLQHTRSHARDLDARKY